MEMVMFTKEIGGKIRLMVMASITIKMGLNTKEIGWKTNSTAMELRHGQMVQFIKAIIS